MTGIIILAAGASTRMGTPKQRLEYQHQTLLQRAVKAAVDSFGNPVIVVLGANNEQILPDIADQPVQIVHNPDWEEGMSSSIGLGVQVLQESYPTAEHVIFMLCDQPFVDATVLNQLICMNASVDAIVACEYQDTVGAPVLFAKKYFSELQSLKGQEGAKKLLFRHKSLVKTLPFPAGFIDIDTQEDYEKLNQQQ